MISFLYPKTGISRAAGRLMPAFKRFGKAGMCLIVIGLAGCGSDKPPMPFDAETRDQFVYHFEEVAETNKEAIRAIDNNRIRARAIVTDVYKPVIEDELGYDFDRTMRHYRFYRMDKDSRSPWRRRMDEAYQYLAGNFEEAYENKLISKEAYDLFAFEEQAGQLINDNQLKILDYMLQCQEQDGGMCASSTLNQILPQDVEGLHALVPYIDIEQKLAFNQSESFAIEDLRQSIYDAAANWMITESGETGYNAPTMIFLANERFSIDQEKIDKANQLAAMLEEEKQRLGLDGQGES